MGDLTRIQRSTASFLTGIDETFAAEVDTNGLEVTDTIRREGVFSSLTVGTTPVPVRVGASNLADRKVVTLHNNSNRAMWWGFSDSVSTSNGTPIGRGEFFAWEVEAAVTIWVVSDQANQNARISEAG